MLLGSINKKNYYLEQNPMTKQFRIEVDNLNTGKRRTYTNSCVMRKIICMFI